MGKKQEDQNYCPVCGQPDNCGDCDHTPMDPLTAASVIVAVNQQLYKAEGRIESLEDKLDRKEEYVQNLEAQLRELRGRNENLFNKAYDDDGFAFCDRVELLRNSVSEKVDHIARLERERDTWKSEAKSKDIQIEALRGKYDIRGRVLDEVRTTGHNLRSEIKKLTDDLLAAHEEYDYLNDKFLRLQKRFDENLANPLIVVDGDTVTALREEVRMKEKVIETWKATAADRRSKVLELTDVIRVKDIQIDQMRSSAAKDKERLKAVRNAVGHD